MDVAVCVVCGLASVAGSVASVWLMRRHTMLRRRHMVIAFLREGPATATDIGAAITLHGLDPGDLYAMLSDMRNRGQIVTYRSANKTMHAIKEG